MSQSKQTQLLVDIGNSNINWRIAEHYHSTKIADFDANLIPPHKSCLISCVAHFELIEAFKNPRIIKPKPYKNLSFDYDLTQLGVDRFLAIIAAFEAYPEQDLMIMDIGTFVTIDYIRNHQHSSGGIAPGLQLLTQTHHFSGADSQAAWRLGTQNLLQAYIKDRLSYFKGKILITGGGQQFIKLHKVVYHQNLVIQGLAIINEYQ